MIKAILPRRKNGSYAVLKAGAEKPIKPVVPNKRAALALLKRHARVPRYMELSHV